MPPSIDLRRLRGLLAEERVSHTELARACGLGRTYLSSILAERIVAGELARFKIASGLERLGLEVPRAN